MNRVLFHICVIMALASAVVVSSCSRKETNTLEVPSQSILVSMPGQTGTTTFDSRNITSLEVVSTPKGWTVDNIDMYASTITVTAPSTFDDGEVESGTLSLKGYTHRHYQIGEHISRYCTQRGRFQLCTRKLLCRV